ncbi:MAG TPA: response regulator transcription factor [Bryobacteraceae bacterium]|nr:response regulator transcription factor [Bryobacteraceae bacterium]
MRFLLVDADTELYSALESLFRQCGYALDFEPDAAVVSKRVESCAYDLVILDVTLPGACGFDLLTALRKTSQIPILILSSAADPGDRVRGLNLGADDYLSKPVFPEELLARVEAILRRAAALRPSRADLLEAGDLCLFPGNRDATFHGKPLRLTAMECEILEHLIRCRGRVVSRDALSLHLYKRLSSPYDRAIDTHISRIRRKLGAGRNMILSIRGAGYQLRTGGEREAP